VSAVVLDFLDPLAEAPDVRATGPDGVEVPATTELVEDDVARTTFRPQRAPGAYEVRYRFASRDGAPQEGAHRFRLSRRR